ncbi:MAG: DUF554 domain-containing protein [Anaerolineales bacterium]|nr:DUF554 domain-containing protein [Anaerolineales bacterium]
MIGTILNVITVAMGSTLGLLIGDRLPKNTQDSVITGLGLVTLVVGMQNAFLSGNIIIPLISLVIGVLIGEWVNVQQRLDNFAGWLQTKVGGKGPGGQPDGDMSDRERFINGFVTASLVFCIGPLTFIGSLQDGMSGDYQLLAIKSVLDGFASLAFAASLGVGVMFSIITIIVLQGGLAVTGYFAGAIMTDPMIDEMTATGGLLLIGLSLILLDIKKPRIANFLPALLIAPLLVAVATALGIEIYPKF